MIKIENLSQPYGLKGIHCTIPTGKLVGIMGANGAGKSTLLKSQQLAYLAQNTEIHWDLSVYDVIALGLPNPLNRAKEQEKVRSISETFSVSHLLEKSFRQLSGGEKARVQLARCCVKNVPLLLADEPIATLDPFYQIDMMEQLKSLTPSHTCVVAIHHLSLAYKFCDEVILLNQGQIIANGETTQVLTAENLANAFSIWAEIDEAKKEIMGIEKLSNELYKTDYA